MYPISVPKLHAKDILDSEPLRKVIYDLADLFDVKQIYTRCLDLDAM